MFNDIINQVSVFLYTNRNIVSLILIIIYFVSEFFFARDYFGRNNKRIKKERIYPQVDSFAMLEIIVNFIPFLACYIIFHEYVFRQLIIGFIIWIVCTVLTHVLAFLSLSDNDRKEFLNDLDNQ